LQVHVTNVVPLWIGCAASAVEKPLVTCAMERKLFWAGHQALDSRVTSDFELWPYQCCYVWQWCILDWLWFYTKVLWCVLPELESRTLLIYILHSPVSCRFTPISCDCSAY